MGVAVIGDPDHRGHVGPVGVRGGSSGRECSARRNSRGRRPIRGRRGRSPGVAPPRRRDRRNRPGHPERSRARPEARQGEPGESTVQYTPEGRHEATRSELALPKVHDQRGVILDHTLDDGGEQPIYSTDRGPFQSNPLPAGEGARRAGEGLRLRCRETALLDGPRPWPMKPPRCRRLIPLYITSAIVASG